MRALLLASVLLAACATTECPEPRYDGKASDEAWRSVLDAEKRARFDAAKSPHFTTPTAGATIPASPEPVLRWNSAIAQVSRPSGAKLAHRARSWPQQLSDLLVAPAYAHLPPVTGVVHLLRIAVPGKACPMEILTTDLEAKLSLTDAQSLAIGKPVSLTAFGVYLEENRVTDGPFSLEKPLEFSVAK